MTHFLSSPRLLVSLVSLFPLVLVLSLSVLTSVCFSVSQICPFVCLFLHLHIFSLPCEHPLSLLPGSVFVLRLSVCLCIDFHLSVILSLSSSSAPPQVTVGTGLRSPMAPAQGVCGSSFSTPRLWVRGLSSSRPLLCTAVLSPRSCCRRSTSSQVGLLGDQLPVSLQEGWHRWGHETRLMRVSTARDMLRERPPWGREVWPRTIITEVRGYYKGTSLRESELFINQQMFIEHLLCAKHRGYSGEQDRPGPLLL